jgi:hypothetical protein
MTTCDLVRPRAIALCAALAALLRVAPASAQAEDQASARALFNEARDLMKAGHYDEACPKLEAANKLYSASGVLLNLGDCYEHLGKTASAWTEFGEAAFAAERTGRAGDRAEALRRQGAIEPRLTRLTVRVSKDAPGLVVKRDGTALDRGAWGTAIPVDPGQHEVTAEAGGFVPWSGTVSATDPGQTAGIDVPELRPAPAQAATIAPPPPHATSVAPPAVPTAATSEPPTYWTSRRVASVAVTGVGIVGMGVGGIVALAAKSKYNTALGEPGIARHNDSVSAGSTADVATVVVSVGAALAVGGLVFWLTAPSAQVRVGTNGAGLFVRGAF